MAVVDHERCWYALKEHVLSKRSHGQDELNALMAELEVDNLIAEADEGFDARPPRRTIEVPSGELAAVPGRERVMASR